MVKTAQLALRLTDQEKEEIKQEAEKLNMSITRLFMIMWDNWKRGKDND